MYSEQYTDPDDPENKNPRSVYIITFYDGAHTREKMFKICDSFTGQRYELPEISQLNTQIQRMYQSIQNQRVVYDRTKQQLRMQLMEFDNIQGNP